MHASGQTNIFFFNLIYAWDIVGISIKHGTSIVLARLLPAASSLVPPLGPPISLLLGRP
jgi:hypothetical protein